MKKQFIYEFKQGRKTNFFAREIDNGVWVLDKITKACGFTLICGTQEQINEYLEQGKFECVGIQIARA